MKKIAVRNIRLCTKDCLCLYVCPTGAADTENSIIDVNKCIGCGVCAQSCPSGAISMVPTEYPPQQPKEKNVADALYALLKSKTVQERIARQLAEWGLTGIKTAGGSHSKIEPAHGRGYFAGSRLYAATERQYP